MNPRILVRMARWARNPPSEKRVIFGLAVIAAAFALFAIERWIGWPEWLQVDQPRVGTPRR